VTFLDLSVVDMAVVFTTTNNVYAVTTLIQNHSRGCHLADKSPKNDRQLTNVWIVKYDVT